MQTSKLIKTGSSRLPGHLPGNHKVPDSMPAQSGLSATWERNFTPIASTTQLLNRKQYCVLCNQVTAEKQV